MSEVNRRNWELALETLCSDWNLSLVESDLDLGDRYMAKLVVLKTCCTKRSAGRARGQMHGEGNGRQGAWGSWNGFQIERFDIEGSVLRKDGSMGQSACMASTRG